MSSKSIIILSIYLKKWRYFCYYFERHFFCTGHDSPLDYNAIDLLREKITLEKRFKTILSAQKTQHWQCMWKTRSSHSIFIFSFSWKYWIHMIILPIKNTELKILKIVVFLLYQILNGVSLITVYSVEVSSWKTRHLYK